jgi:hypothetical protein
MPAEQFIFVGFELDAALAARLAECGESDRVFMENVTYLETVEAAGLKYLGKRVEVGSPADRLEDTARSVISLLARIIPGFTAQPANARLVAVEEQRPVEL